jgi:hypothetical protein
MYGNNLCFFNFLFVGIGFWQQNYNQPIISSFEDQPQGTQLIPCIPELLFLFYSRQPYGCFSCSMQVSQPHGIRRTTTCCIPRSGLACRLYIAPSPLFFVPLPMGIPLLAFLCLRNGYPLDFAHGNAMPHFCMLLTVVTLCLTFYSFYSVLCLT